MNAHLFATEWRMLRRSPITWALVLLLCSLCAGALISGAANQRAKADADTEFMAKATEEDARFRQMLADVEAGRESSPFVARPMSISRASIIEDGVLGDFGAGAGDLFPSRVKVRLFENSASLFDNYQFANPTLLRFGGFDMNAVVIVLLPLLMIALCFDALGSDRASGRNRLLQLSGASEARVLFYRLIVRCGLVWLAVALPSGAGALLNVVDAALGERLVHYAAWLGGTILYAGIWTAMIGTVIYRARGTGQAAAGSVGLWALFILVIPALATAGVQAAMPSPSRLAYLSDVRAATSQADEKQREVLSRYNIGKTTGHGGSLDPQAPFRDAFIRTSIVENATRSHRERFDQSVANRSKAQAFLSFLSPAIAADTLLSTLTSSDAERYRVFQADARSLLAELSVRLGPAIMRGDRISLAEYGRLPAMPTAASPLTASRTAILSSIAILTLMLLVAGIVALGSIKSISVLLACTSSEHSRP